MAGSTPSSSSAGDARLRSPLRQNGFSIAANENTLANPNQHYLSRSRNSTGSTVTLREHAVGMSSNGTLSLKAEVVGDDGDTEMIDGNEPSASIRPLPIPRTYYEPRSVGGTTASHTPSDVATPPDHMLRRPSVTKTPAASSSLSSAIRLPSVSPSYRGSPRVGSQVSNHWSPPNTDRHIYSNGGASYPYSSVKPYLSTSFKTSAERSGSAMDDEDDIDEDVFGHTASQLGLQDSPAYARRRGTRGGTAAMDEMDGEGDAAGVFSFSSPYLRPQSVDDSVPALPPSPPFAPVAAHATSTSGAPVDRVLSPSITARSLQKLSLGGGVEMSHSPSQGSNGGGGSGSGVGGGGVGASRRRPSHIHHASFTNGAAPSAYSRSLPSANQGLQARRLSSGRLGRPIMPPSSVSAYSIASTSGGAGAGGAATFGSATLFSRSPSGNSPYGRSPGASGMSFTRPSPYGTPSGGRVPSAFAVEMPSRRERSRSRQRWGVPRGPEPAAAFADEEADEDGEEGEEAEEEEEDDDATDDEMIMTTSTSAGGTIRASRSISRRPDVRDSIPAVPDPAPAPATTEDDGTGPPPDEMVEVTAIRDRLGGAANCAAFIAKLWFLVTRPQRYGRYIHWNATGSTVILSTDPDLSNEFASEVLPRLWNHANYSSFIRQMNLYGFQRLPSSRILDREEMDAARAQGLPGVDTVQGDVNKTTAQQLYGAHSSFLHPKFARGREDLLPLLKPRNAKKPKAGGGAGKKEEDGAGEE
ncbi:hypothetical protein BDZ90DRAFT_244239 [Jaminaea rosea]|uniref:HSF-type DNA-binding domain-containing protein n=1 Tax=Jaminaea rosea TaxID=1569628 RepID=A0A316UHE9_9BASI|nr:hypothetical protein BDZ90DRAFT_244239 [Jaminaea rosea]PWN24757.1 hypothetical protein BDZ90DRAFT_244239 [Jaminaea rosea]